MDRENWVHLRASEQSGWGGREIGHRYNSWEGEGESEDTEPGGMLETYGPAVQKTQSACAGRSKHSHCRPQSPDCEVGPWLVSGNLALRVSSVNSHLRLVPCG